ncbi:hypothetical protein SAMN05428988_1610 [Chitinophaga sp. YR573]|uniref:hypothetical protein n=1 Tax=Chitinophaga sp. YR573 TaxID=1881040 RepID=UPI0008CA6C39|nr:hypothetical protein [Chitinophaga sp. YR573]SEW05295.1 hypothetical protein SAMN05428988_1610 [Chitinophaga sp. YR573]
MRHSTRPGFIIGFHGCDQEVKDALICKGLPMKPSVKSYDWLGNGCYFWENNYERALEFAQNPPGKKVIKNPTVIGAVIDLQYCLDLLDTSFLKMVKNSFITIASTGDGIDGGLPENIAPGPSKDLLIRHLDCAVIENVHKDRIARNVKPFDSARGVFVEGEPLYPGSGFNEKNHIQICIRNPNCIKGFFDPLHEVPWPPENQQAPSYLLSSLAHN